MRVHKIGSFALQIFIVGVCSLGVFANQDLEVNNVKYEFGARLPKRDVASQTIQKKLIYNILPKPTYRTVENPIREKLEQIVGDTHKKVAFIRAPKVIIREDVTLSPRSIVRPFADARKVQLPKVKLPIVEVVSEQLPKAEVQNVELPQIQLLKIKLPTLELPKVELSEVELPKIESAKVELEKFEVSEPNTPSLREQIVQTLAVTEPIKTPIKEITKPRKLKKYPLHYSTIPLTDSKNVSNEPVPQKVKILQKPVAFSFTKDSENNISQDNTVSGTEIHESSKDGRNEEREEDNKKGNDYNVERKVEDRREESDEKDPNTSFKHGGGSEHISGRYSEKGDKGIKKYNGHEDYEKAEKGHHDKEGHEKEYEEDKGNKKHHHYDDAHHSHHHKAEKGKKDAEFDEESKYSKGWSTKGEHKIHKLDDYEKKKVFYDESHDEGDEEEGGEYYEEQGFKKGGGEKGDHRNSGHHKDYYARKGEHKKGGHHHDRKGHDEDDKHIEYYKHRIEHGKKDEERESKKWGRNYQEHEDHPMRYHREPTRHTIWNGKRNDHDVSGTQYVSTTIQSKPKNGKTKRQQQRNDRVNQKKHFTQRSKNEHAKRDVQSNSQNRNLKNSYEDWVPSYERFYFITHP